MGQKTHPYGFRLVYNKTWHSRWYADNQYAETLEADLKLRNHLKRRLAHALDELKAVGEYDYAVVNEDLDRAVAQVSAIIDGEALRVPRQDNLPEVVDNLRRTISAEAMRISTEQKKVEVKDGR